LIARDRHPATKHLGRLAVPFEIAHVNQATELLANAFRCNDDFLCLTGSFDYQLSRLMHRQAARKSDPFQYREVTALGVTIRPSLSLAILAHPPKTENPPQTLAGQGTPGTRGGENRRPNYVEDRDSSSCKARRKSLLRSLFGPGGSSSNRWSKTFRSET
jgi:hypothetical protein